LDWTSRHQGVIIRSVRSHRTRIGVIAVLALLVVVSGIAFARTAGYTGKGVNLRAGQSKGLPILVGFDLVGKGCPTGPHCFDNARVRNPNAVSWAYPNCREVLDSAFELRRTARVAKRVPHHFHLSGPNFSYAEDHVVFDGRFLKGGRTARGWFTVEDAGCSTGRVFWVAHPD
jgi:hypothetical protein